MVLVLAVCVLGCGKGKDKGHSEECQRLTDIANRGWDAYVRAVEHSQPSIEQKREKFAPDGYKELQTAADEAIAAWKAANAEAKQQATDARFGKSGSSELSPGQAALAKAQTAHDKAKAAIEAAFAPRLKEGADSIKRREDELTPEKGKKLSTKQRIALEEKLASTKERVAKNNTLVFKAKDRLLEKADAILDLARQAVEDDDAAVLACRK